MNKIAVVGSRDFSELEYVDQYVESLPTSVTIISGGARGVDKRAVQAAKARGMETIEILANWEENGKAAGFIRNSAIVANADIVVAFWDGKSRGTLDTINKALKAKHIRRVIIEKGNI